MTRDWKAEKEELKKQSKFFRAQAGNIYTIEFMDEGGEKYEQVMQGKKLMKRDFQVVITGGEYNNIEKVWSLTVGGPGSVYGKCCDLFEAAGQATGVLIHLKAQGEKLDREYTIQEHTELQFKQEDIKDPKAKKPEKK